MMKIEGAQIMKVDTVSNAGRMYSKECVQEALDRLNGKEVFGTFASVVADPTVDLETVSHTCSNLRIENDWLVGDVKILDTHYGVMLQDMLVAEHDFKMTPRGIGFVTEDAWVKDYEIIAVDVELKE